MSIIFEARAARSKLWPFRESRLGGKLVERGLGFIEGYVAGASREVTDEQADAAQIAFHEYVFGPDEPLTARDIGVTRQAWKVAIQAARALADKETP